MKRYLFYTYLLISMLFAACEMRDELKGLPMGDQQGMLQLELEINDKTNESRTIAATQDELALLAADIVDETGKIVKHYASLVALEEEGGVILIQGNYTVRLYTAEKKNAGWEHPHYEGTSRFTIEEGKVTQTKVTCSIQNVKVMVNVSEEFKKYFEPVYEVHVSNGDGILVYNDTVKKAGYFTVSDQLTMLVSVALKGSGQYTTYSETLSNETGTIAAKDFFNVVLDVKHDVGSVEDPMLDIDLSYNDKDIDIEVPTEPVVPDSIAPVLSGVDFDIDQPIVFVEGENPAVKVDIKAPKKIKHLKVRIDSELLTEEVLAIYGIPVEFDLADLTPELKETLMSINLITDAPIYGETAMIFDISAFMSMLEPGEHKFHLELVDQTDVQDNKSLVIIMKAK